MNALQHAAAVGLLEVEHALVAEHILPVNGHQTLDVLIKYFTYHQMPVVSGNYWPMVHGNTPDDVKKDAEGLQIMRTVGNNMAWLLKCIEAGKKAGIEAPETEPKIMTNFIR